MLLAAPTLHPIAVAPETMLRRERGGVCSAARQVEMKRSVMGGLLGLFCVVVLLRRSELSVLRRERASA